jgi:hypothetical protein
MAGRGPVVRVEGARELARAFRAAGGQTRELSGAYRQLAREFAGPARSAAPSRTGALAGSTRGLARSTAAILAAGSARVPYAGVIHWGNPSVKTYPARAAGAKRSTGTLGVIRANPWLYNVVDKRRDEVLEAFDRNVAELLRRQGLM